MSAGVKRTRLPRHRRVAEAARPPMRLTDRDREVICAVHACRLLRGDQIAALFFGSRSTAQARLSRLFQHEYLERHFLSTVSGGPASSPALYTLGKRGVEVLVTDMGLERSDIHVPPRGALGWRQVEHLLAVNDVRVAITRAAKAQGWDLEEWRDAAAFRADPDYTVVADKKGKKQRKPVLPDGYFCLDTPRGKARCFLEVDRGTEALARFRPQVRVYQAYTASGGYQARFQAKSLRVLVVTTTARRLASLQAAVRAEGGDRKYWFTTFDRVTAESVLTGNIWQTLESDRPQPLVDLAGA